MSGRLGQEKSLSCQSGCTGRSLRPGLRTCRGQFCRAPRTSWRPRQARPAHSLLRPRPLVTTGALWQPPWVAAALPCWAKLAPPDPSCASASLRWSPQPPLRGALPGRRLAQLLHHGHCHSDLGRHLLIAWWGLVSPAAALQGLAGAAGVQRRLSQGLLHHRPAQRRAHPLVLLLRCQDWGSLERTGVVLDSHSELPKTLSGCCARRCRRSWLGAPSRPAGHVCRGCRAGMCVCQGHGSLPRCVTQKRVRVKSPSHVRKDRMNLCEVSAVARSRWQQGPGRVDPELCCGTAAQATHCAKVQQAPSSA